METKPVFKRLGDGTLVLGYSRDAQKVSAKNKLLSASVCLPAETVKKNAVDEVLKLGGDVTDQVNVLGHYQLQFGAYRGKSFRWMLENGLGYAAWLVNNLQSERLANTRLSANKFALMEYLLSFDEGKEAVEMKKSEIISEREKKAVGRPVNPSRSQKRPYDKDSPSTSRMSSLVVGKKVTPAATKKSPKKMKATPTKAKSTATAIPWDDMKDDELVTAVQAYESSSSQGDPVTKAHAPSQVDDAILPEGWKKTLPEADHQWIAQALFKRSKTGKAEVAWERVDKLWWSPPQPSLKPSQLPRPERYFATRLLLWMPRKLWQMRLCCPHPTCKDHELTSAGIYQRVRQVLDIDGFYNLAAEYLECSRCKRKQISWSGAITRQLDMGHRVKFPVLLTYRYACDMRVARLMRQRGLGNSSTQLRHKLVEQHSEMWSQKALEYLTDCQTFTDAADRNMIVMPDVRKPPPMHEIPRPQWLQTVYCNDVIVRLEEVKATITSVFGTVLKMDSTKKVVKKLAGYSAGTALWATNIGNEYGQVLMSVLTASEGYGLRPMVKGVIKRYKSAGVTPPQILYVDRDCCGKRSALRDTFKEWNDITIRLDIWHFMRRIAAGVTTDSHQLYSLFMSRLSACIFEWSLEDMERLREAKRAELKAQKIRDPSDSDVWARVTRKEMTLHCRRKTRGVEETARLIDELLEAFSGENGHDLLGVPLLDTERIKDIWSSQRRHVACIQDPDEFSLYTETHKLQKGGIMLPVFRCARGSTSLESFHLHLNRFIPGTSASGMHFQAYLLEGLMRWNMDRASAAVSSTTSSNEHYSGQIKSANNALSSSILGEPLHPSYCAPREYTGELIGIEYLYSQTGEVLQDCTLDPDSVESERLDSCLEDEDEDDDDDDEGYDEPSSHTIDPTVCSYDFDWEPQQMKRLTIAKVVESPTTRSTRRQLFRSPYRGGVGSASTSDAEPSAPSTSASTSTRLIVLSTSPDRPTTSASTSARRTALSSPANRPSTSAGASALPTTPQDRPTTSASVSVPSTPPDRPSTSTSYETPTHRDSPEESLDHDNVPGYSHVQDLAQFLFSLRNQTGPILNHQADEIIRLWQNLIEYDRRPTRFSPRYKTKATGRFKASKSLVAPGVESTKRCFHGENTGPAQWPDSNRYVECLVSKLCSEYPGPVQQNNVLIQRWSLVCRAYRDIRQKVLDNGPVMKNTGIQLFDINQATLRQWYIKKTSSEEKQIVEKTINVPPPPPFAAMPLQPPAQKATLITAPIMQQFRFTLPPNTAGQARTFRPIAPRLPAPTTTFFTIGQGQGVSGTSLAFLPTSTTGQDHSLRLIAQPTAHTSTATTAGQVVPGTSIPRSTLWYQRKKREREAAGEKVKTNRRTKGPMTCRQCGKERTKEGHTQYYGNWYCKETQETSGVSYEEWRSQFADKKKKK